MTLNSGWRGKACLGPSDARVSLCCASIGMRAARLAGWCPQLGSRDLCATKTPACRFKGHGVGLCGGGAIQGRGAFATLLLAAGNFGGGACLMVLVLLSLPLCLPFPPTAAVLPLWASGLPGAWESWRGHPSGLLGPQGACSPVLQLYCSPTFPLMLCLQGSGDFRESLPPS